MELVTVGNVSVPLKGKSAPLIETNSSRIAPLSDYRSEHLIHICVIQSVVPLEKWFFQSSPDRPPIRHAMFALEYPLTSGRNYNWKHAFIRCPAEFISRRRFFCEIISKSYCRQGNNMPELNKIRPRITTS